MCVPRFWMGVLLFSPLLLPMTQASAGTAADMAAGAQVVEQETAATAAQVPELWLTLPPARVGQLYDESLVGIQTIATGRQSCPKPKTDDLTWLQWQCNGQAPRLIGTVPRNLNIPPEGKRVYADWEITDVLHRVTRIHLRIDVIGQQHQFNASQNAEVNAFPVHGEPAQALRSGSGKSAPVLQRRTKTAVEVQNAEPVSVASLPLAETSPDVTPLTRAALVTANSAPAPPPVSAAVRLTGNSSTSGQDEKEVTLTAAAITSPLRETDTSIKGIGTGSTDVTGVAIIRLRPSAPAYTRCLHKNEVSSAVLDNYPSGTPVADLVVLTGNSRWATVNTSSGTFDTTPNDGGEFKAGERIQAVQILEDSTHANAESLCVSSVVTVTPSFDFYRTNVNAVLGIVLSNSSLNGTNGNFSEAHQFIALNADHNWRLPGDQCEAMPADKSVLTGSGRYVRDSVTGYRICGSKWARQFEKCGSSQSFIDAYKLCEGQPREGYHASWRPGFNSYIETRLTSIAVSTPAVENAAGSANNSAPKTSIRSAVPHANDTAPAANTTSTLLNSAQTFRVMAGAYLPWIPVHGSGMSPHGLLVAPIAKAGFDTVAGSTTVNNVIFPDGSNKSLNFQPAYKFYSYGLRVGEVSLFGSSAKAPLLNSYLDVTIGRFSNLQSFICHLQGAPGQGGSGDTALLQNSGCTQYPGFTVNKDSSGNVTGGNFLLSRKQLYRISLEGLLQVPLTGKALPLYVGFNANIAQHSVQAERIDPGYPTPDDIRILFGTRLDINKIAAAVNAFNK